MTPLSRACPGISPEMPVNDFQTDGMGDLIAVTIRPTAPGPTGPGPSQSRSGRGHAPNLENQRAIQQALIRLGRGRRWTQTEADVLLTTQLQTSSSTSSDRK